MYALSLAPSSVPRLISSRIISPTDKCITPHSEAMILHCVPFPEAGGPITTNTLPFNFEVSKDVEASPLGNVEPDVARPGDGGVAMRSKLLNCPNAGVINDFCASATVAHATAACTLSTG